MPVDYSKYPKNWFTEIRPAILLRADNKCEQCKVPNGAWVCRGEWNGVEVWQNDDGQIFRTDNGEHISDSYVGDVWEEKNKGLIKVILTVAHLDHNPENNAPENLRAWCQLHHLRHDAELHKKNSQTTREKNKGLQRLF